MGIFGEKAQIANEILGADFAEDADLFIFIRENPRLPRNPRLKIHTTPVFHFSFYIFHSTT